MFDFIRRQYDPTPRWAKLILHNQEKIMSALDNLTAQEDRMETITTAILADIATLTAELAAANTAQDPAIQAVVDKFTALADKLQAVVPAATPAPTP